MDSPLRYVVLHHTGVAEPHFDIMLERAAGSDLQTWRSAIWPVAGGAALMPLPDHRRVYLDYEGEVSGGRGWVKCVSRGTYEIDASSTVHLADESGVRFTFANPRAAG